MSDRYLPVACVPWLREPSEIAREIERAVEGGHRGVNLPGKTPRGQAHLTDPRWDPIWDVCEKLGVPVHFHGSANLTAGASMKTWDGYSTRQAHSASTSTSSVTPAQIIPQLIFSGVTERFPNLKVVFAEAGIGGLNYVLGYKNYYEEGFSAGAGFLGIAVALVGRNHPFGVVIAAILFATLSQGGLAVNALVPKQIVDVLQAVVIIAMATAVPEVRRILLSVRRP